MEPSHVTTRQDQSPCMNAFRRGLLYIVPPLLLFGLVGVLTAGDLPSRGLRVLLATPLANIALSTAKEIERSFSDVSRSPIMAKPKYAELRIKYEPIPPYTKPQVHAELVRIIEEYGWIVSHQGPYYYYATLSQPSGTLLAILHSYDNGTPYVTLSITNRRF